MTKAQLEKFIKIRNKSDYQSNLQFLIDARSCGLDLKELGNPKRQKNEDGFEDFVWGTPFGKLVEHYGELSLVK